MQTKSKQNFSTVLWLMLSLGLTVVLAYLMFGKTFLANAVNLHLHDTYFVVSGWLVLTPLFMLVKFVIFFIKTLKRRFTSILSCWILISSGLLLVIFLTILIKTFSEFAFSNGTWYPPLSALDPNQTTTLEKDPVTTFIANFLTVIQAIIVVMLLFATLKCGVYKSKEASKLI